ncbi:MAG TPA: 50S ribosomal protein L10 [Longilinea sp.]|nr:50S ribosomal protein L10 [Longilinea sp.]
MAFNKQRKIELQDQYVDWLKKSQAIFVVSYSKMSMKDIDAFRAKAREAGGELHVVKNTLMLRALETAKMPTSKIFDGTSLVGFAFSDPPALAKVISDGTSKSEIFAIKGGMLGNEILSVASVKALADLPPLPVVRAKLLGLFNTPATQLVRTLAEPARQLAYVVKAHSEQAAPAAA